MEYIGVAILMGIFLGIALCKMHKETYFNSNSNKCIYDEIFIPTFKVTNIELTEDAGHNKVAKYTILNYFFAKKNDKNFKYQQFYFYDKIDKYKVGDEITFTNYEN